MNVRIIALLLMFNLCLASCGSNNPAPVVHYGQKSGAGSAGIHTVVGGDTLYSLSTRYRLPMRDIVVLNRMKAPFRLYVGQRVKLPPPQEYKVRQGDTLYGVSRLFGVNSSEVARLNQIRSPYVLRVGQTLRLPSVIEQARIVEMASSPVKHVERTSLSDPVPSPQAKPQQVASRSKPAEIRNGVPVPQDKPNKALRVAQSSKPKQVRISKVRTKTPKRASSKFIRPVRGKLLSNFGAKKSGLHNDGINIAAPRGTPVKAAENGVIVYAGNALKGSGNLVLVRHENQWMTAYGHLDSIAVKKGQVVRRGISIGKVGSTGSVSSPQLHFEVRRGTSALNPTKYML